MFLACHRTSTQKKKWKSCIQRDEDPSRKANAILAGRTRDAAIIQAMGCFEREDGTWPGSLNLAKQDLETQWTHFADGKVAK